MNACIHTYYTYVQETNDVLFFLFKKCPTQRTLFHQKRDCVKRERDAVLMGQKQLSTVRNL